MWKLQANDLDLAESRRMDYFSRQKSVPDWYQPLIEAQCALVLGVGGIGCTVARELCRLGVGEVVLLDNDVVSVSNINRQVLYSVGDVGRKKVHAAVDGLERDNIKTRVSAVHCDAVKEWGRVVKLARNSSVVFNCIDYGEYFDTAVMSLCVSLGLPYLTGSSFGHTAIAECYPPVELPQSGPCWVCNNTPAKSEIIERVTPDKVAELDNVEFLPKDSYMPSNQEIGSSVLPCTLAATLTVGAWLNALHGYTPPNWITCDFAMFQLYSYHSEPNSQCLICQSAPRYSSILVDLYFGTEQVSLTSVNGSSIPFSRGAITNPATQSYIEQAKNRRESVLTVEGDKCVFLPAVPAAQLEFSHPAVYTPLPDLLTAPSVKSKDGTQAAIRSGGRSCIVPFNRGCYRLKGCGNYVDVEGMRHAHPGFPFLKLETKENGYEIRGCCFEHTVLSEQYMSHRVGQILLEHNIAVGNKPIGFWKYDIPEYPISAVPKYCGLFETLGEKRVGSHLIPGLEALVPLLFPAVTKDEVWSLFPADRQREQITPTWSACCTGANKSCPVDMAPSARLSESVPGPSPLEGIPPNFIGLWLQSAFAVRQFMDQGGTSTACALMSLVYRRVGWEMGTVKRVLESHRINWGYFIDHNPFEPHCNAHPNNFIILPPGQSSLLAPVDFDLSFEETGFFSPYTGEYDQSLFDSWLSSEHVELERALAGEMVNTGVQMAQTNELSPAHQGLCWAFRDTMLLGYRAGYTGTEQVALPDSSRSCVDALVKMAVLWTNSAVA